MTQMTVRTLAKQFGIPPELLLSRMHQAGLKVQTVDHEVTAADKFALLNWMKQGSRAAPEKEANTKEAPPEAPTSAAASSTSAEPRSASPQKPPESSARPKSTPSPSRPLASKPAKPSEARTGSKPTPEGPKSDPSKSRGSALAPKPTDRKGSRKKRRKDQADDDFPLILLQEEAEVRPVVRPHEKRRTTEAVDRLLVEGFRHEHGFQGSSGPLEKKLSLTGSPISVSELARSMGIKATGLMRELFKLGVMATINQTLDPETAELVASEMGYEIEIKKSDLHASLFSDSQGDLEPRAPVITIMGHVDHGKTSLLDYIRKTHVTEQEHGGITQHIGAYHVELGDRFLTFLDTPGHAAFTHMRARGAQVTDIVVLVVAGDDGVMPQTVEAIQHAKAANVAILVAVTKMDRPDFDLERIKTQLSQYDILSESWGGRTQFIGVSSKTGEGIEDLLKGLLLEADVLELKAKPTGPARGTIIEAHLDKALGHIATALVTSGLLKRGDMILSDEQLFKARLLIDDQGRRLEEAGPSMPVMLLGFDELPEVGSRFAVPEDIKLAQEYVEERKLSRSQKNASDPYGSKTFEEHLSSQGVKHVPLIIRTDVQGTAEAVKGLVAELGEKLKEIRPKIVSIGVGAITEADVALAQASSALVIGFNVRADAKAKNASSQTHTEIRYYSVIYHLLEDLEQLCRGMLAPKFADKILGIAAVREVFRSSKFGSIAGCMVTEGNIERHRNIRVLRHETVIFEGQLESLRRFKEDVKEARAGMECGIGVKGYNDIKVGDSIEVFDRVEVKDPHLKDPR